MKQIIKKWEKFFVINLAMEIFTFFMTISLGLVNHLDGIWHSAFSLAGNWERGEGRWVWPYIDKMRFGLAAEPLTSVVSIVLFIVGNIFLLELFEIGPECIKAYLISFLFLMTTSVGVWLTFKYAAISFALPYLFSVVALFIVKKGINVSKYSDAVTIVAAAICIVLLMGQYQAFINCTCMIFLAQLMIMFYRECEKKEVISFSLKSAISIVLGGTIYLAGIPIMNSIYGSKMTDYNGSGSLSISYMISRIPARFKTTFYYFKEYFFGQMYRWNRLQDHYIVIGLFMVLVLSFCVIGTVEIFKKNKVYGILFVICMLLMPVAANVVLFVAPDAFLSIQMICGLAFYFPIMMLIAFEIQEKGFNKKWAGILLTICCIVMIYGNYIATQIDQEACKEGRTGTVTLAGEVLDTLLELGYADNGGKVCFIGMPVGNERFMYSEHFYLANNLMQFGDWGSTGSSHKQTWEGIYREYFGYYVQACDSDEFYAILDRDDVKAMPMFPRRGSIANIDGITVVKISNKY
ncbi:MAG: glucosyltransferase domain-containing protein [Lachnospiraceae bacterium]|nr:glucosyltransferase domain-containing protein [Lachnospiraceae bacterium]